MPTTREADEAKRREDWNQLSSPHGYDQPEFGPALAPRDYKRPRPGADDERRRLRDADAAMQGGAARPNEVQNNEKWDDEDDEGSTSASRLYRE
ncbi:hypothetical protein [Aquabacter spiritensis]|uniref:Uncharacterized protein n=1 Tax=Aquabacter spiritensis TaxID=933073 RepID=A0A4R3LTM8_9HYPH|nr:hypothetical protein [Aquabacter spiritensis]TCT03920.1 hypothetical protein EDC64_10886 [Aquabacter spiritensis]